MLVARAWGWASYYRLSDHCAYPLAVGEQIMGVPVELSSDRTLVVTRKSGEHIECGTNTIQVEKGERLVSELLQRSISTQLLTCVLSLGNHQHLNLTDCTACQYSEHVLEITGEGAEFDTEELYATSKGCENRRVTGQFNKGLERYNSEIEVGDPPEN
jgi:hypothetical protein